ncbi:MAG: DUF4411 family protein [Ignavibacteriaceae bacterium]|nr:DUF4411 family protein [Ignavibacteriaceae bacterium]
MDANFLIEAHRVYYPMDVVPGFWNKISALAKEDKIISIDKVGDEIYNNKDLLAHWCENNLPGNFFRDTSGVMNEYAQVFRWANFKKDYVVQKAIEDFCHADRADAFLVAYCLAEKENRVLVTQEVSRPESKVSIKVPDACIAFGVNYVNTLQMFRNLKETF